MKQITKKSDSMGFGWLALGMLFLFNPNINIIDVFPDFIGYILLCIGCSKLADLNDSIEGALSLFRKMIFVDAGKWLALMWVFGMSVTSERNSSLLLWTFVFSVLELILLIPAFSKLFGGILQFGYFYKNQSLMVEGKKNTTDSIKKLTIAFLMIKSVFAVLPEFADLTNTAYDDSSLTNNLYQHIGTMRLLAFIPVLILGLVWLIRVQRYFITIRRDRELAEGLAERYRTEIEPKTGHFIKRNFHTVMWVLIIAWCLSIDLRLEYLNLFPDILVAIFLAVGLGILHKHTSFRLTPVMVACASYGVVALASSVLEQYFFTEYYYGAIIRNETAMIVYRSLIAVDCLKAVLFIWLVWMTVGVLSKTVLEHTGYVLGREYHNDREQQMIQAVQTDLKHALLWCFGAAVLYSAADVVYDFLAPTYGFMGLIQMFFAFVFIGLFVRALYAIGQAIETKYMLE